MVRVDKWGDRYECCESIRPLETQWQLCVEVRKAQKSGCQQGQWLGPQASALTRVCLPNPVFLESPTWVPVLVPQEQPWEWLLVPMGTWGNGSVDCGLQTHGPGK